MTAVLDRKPLGQLLLNKGLVKPAQLERALDEQRRGSHQKLLGEILIEMRHCSDEQVVEALAESYGVPFARISPRLADPKVISVLPREFLEKQQVLPLFLVDGVLTVAVPEPANVFLLEEIERLSGYQVQVIATPARDIAATLQTYLPGDKVFVIDEIVEEIDPAAFSVVDRPQGLPASRTEDGSPVSKLISYCIYNAVRDRASDIHIEPNENFLRVRYRIDGRLTERLRPPVQMQDAIISRLKEMANLDAARRDVPQEGSIAVMTDKRPIDLRVSTVPGRYGEKIVIRIIDQEKATLNLEKLGFGYDILKQWRKLIAQPSGLLLVTGPSGSGKRTTLYASLQERQTDDLNVCAIEDQIEYFIPGINQFQLNPEAGFDSATAMRAVLQQEPDILLLSEIHNLESARMAAQAAMAGRLILSSLHTNHALEAITRLLNLGLEPYVVGSMLTGVLSQRLVRKLCQLCKEAYEPTGNERRQIEKHVGPVNVLHKAAGCERCRGIGYAGRIGIYELLVPDEHMIERISQSAPLAELRDLAARCGLKPLRLDGLEKVKSGITTLEEVFRASP